MTEINGTELILQKITAVEARFSELKAERESYAADKAAIDKQLGELKTELAGLKKQNERAAILAMPGMPVMSADGQKAGLSWARVIQICAEPRRLTMPGYELEREAYEYMQKTAINAATGAGGGFLVPTTMLAGIIPELRERSIARQLGATVMTGLGPGNYVLAKSKGGITAEHLNTEEEATGTESVATFDQITLTPRPIAAFVPLTRQMMTQAAENMEAWVRREIAIQIALLQDKSFFVGTGTAGAPRGIFLHPSIQSETCVSASIDTTAELWGVLVNFVKKCRDKFALGLSGLGWAAAPGVLYHLAKVKDTTGRPIFESLTQGSFSTAGAPSTVLRYPILDSAQIATGTTTAERLMFGPWGDGVIGEWGTLELLMSEQTETNFRKGRATVRGIAEYDVGFFHADAFVQAGTAVGTPDYDTTAATP